MCIRMQAIILKCDIYEIKFKERKFGVRFIFSKFTICVDKILKLCFYFQ